MKSIRRALILSGTAFLCTLACAAALFIIRPGYESAGFAVLSVPDTIEDSAALELLESAGFSDLIAESTQWVFIDDFGEPIKVPLNRYREFIEPFDPRDDGYAERLKHVFHEQDRRRIIIPLEGIGTAQRPAVLKNRLYDLFDGLDPQIALLSYTVSTLPRSILLVLALITLLVLSRADVLCIAVLPVFAVLGLSGPAGLASIGPAAALLYILKDPLHELYRKIHDSSDTNKGYSFFWYKKRILVSFFFLLLYAVLHISGAIPLWLSILCITALGLTMNAVINIRELYYKQKGRRRFLPLELGSSLSLGDRPVKYVLLFSLAACMLCVFHFVFDLPLAGTDESEHILWNSAPPISREEYQAHLEFQQRFSLVSLWDDAAETESRYLSYRIDDSGLIFSDGEIPQYGVYWDLTDPPVERLLGIGTGIQGRPAFLPAEILALFLLLCISSLAVFRALPGFRHKRLVSSLIERRIAA